MDAALSGVGDIDATCDMSDLNGVHRYFEGWATSLRMLSVVVCSHVPGYTIFVAVDETGALHQMDIAHIVSFRGARLRLSLLARAVVVDDRGFRRLGPASEGALVLLLNGISWRGFRSSAKVNHALTLLDQSPTEGAMCIETVLRYSRSSELIESVLAEDGRRQREVLLVQAKACGLALTSPIWLLRRSRFRLGPEKSCRLAVSLLGHRRAEGDLLRWHERVATDHFVEILRPLDG